MVLRYFFVFFALLGIQARANSSDELYYSQKWLKLGHYEKKIFGGYHSKIVGAFFLDASGANDPRAEFLTSVEKLFHSQPELQCRYLSRTKWLAKVLEIEPGKILDCPERKAWKAKLGAQEVYLVFAANDLGGPSSSFGHTLLRLHNKKNQGSLDLVDYGVNFSANSGTDSGAILGLKGLFGFYLGHYSMLPYHQKILEYSNVEGRDIWEYKINFTEQEVDEMIDHILELDGSGVPYYFLDDNCSKQIMDLIEFVRPEYDLSKYFFDSVIPLDTVKVLSKHTKLLGDEVYRPSLQTQFQRQYSKLNQQEKNVLSEIVNLKSVKPADVNQRKILNAAMDYLAIEEYRGELGVKQLKYELSVQRSKLGREDQLDSDVEDRPSRPYQSHNSDAYYLGFGSLADQSFYQFKLRRAFHDLISDDRGMSPYTQVEVMSFDFRFFFQQQRLDLAKLTLVNLISTAPVTLLDTPSSWLFDLGTEPKLAPYTKFGYGYSFDLVNSRVSHFAVAKAFLDRPSQYLGVGYEFILVNHHADSFRSLVDLIYLPKLGATPENSVSLGLSYDLSKTFELRAQALRKNDEALYLVSLIF